MSRGSRFRFLASGYPEATHATSARLHRLIVPSLNIPKRQQFATPRPEAPLRSVHPAGHSPKTWFPRTRRGLQVSLRNDNSCDDARSTRERKQQRDTSRRQDPASQVTSPHEVDSVNRSRGGHASMQAPALYPCRVCLPSCANASLNSQCRPRQITPWLPGVSLV